MTKHDAEDVLLVTGAAGFVMSNLVRRYLADRPGARVVAVDAQPLDRAAQRFFAPVRDRLEYVQGDVVDDALWRSLPHADGIVHVVHGAAVTSINRLLHAEGRGHPGLPGARRALAVNLDGTLNALAFAQERPRLRRLVYVSSGSVYADDGPNPMPEDGPVVPDGLYGATKLAGEHFTASATRELGVPGVSVRLSGVYGPMDRETPARSVRCAPLVVANRALAGEVVRVRSLEGAGDFVHADDVARAIVSLLDLEAPRHAVYNVAGGIPETVGALLEVARAAVPDLRHEVVPEGEVDVDLGDRPRPGRYCAYDVSRLRAETGWSPRPLCEALPDYVEWLRRSR